MVSAVALAGSPTAEAQTGIPLLTVQPRTMATGTQNPAAGGYWLEDTVMNGSPTGSLVFVSPACVGAKRCPLLVVRSPGGRQELADWLAPVMNRYGMMLLYNAAEAYLDEDLKETLRRFAIDPEKIAILGHCGTGGTALAIGIKNLHVFSRMASMSGSGYPDLGAVDARTTTAEFLIDRGVPDDGNFGHDFQYVRQAQQAGYRVRQTATIRDHAFQAESFEALGRWLHESWTKPPAERTPPVAIAPVPLLTSEAVARLTTFWTRFFQLPDSAWTIERRLPYIRDVVAPVDTMRTLIPMTDMAALAARYPSVAAALKAAGLTGEQHDAYRLALATAMIAWQNGGGMIMPKADKTGWENVTIDPASDLAKNVAFLEAHRDELQALADAGRNPDAVGADGYNLRSHPATLDGLGPLGIWLTP